jgi:hypothetical protein
VDEEAETSGHAEAAKDYRGVSGRRRATGLGLGFRGSEERDCGRKWREETTSAVRRRDGSVPRRRRTEARAESGGCACACSRVVPPARSRRGGGRSEGGGGEWGEEASSWCGVRVLKWRAAATKRMPAWQWKGQGKSPTGQPLTRASGEHINFHGLLSSVKKTVRPARTNQMAAREFKYLNIYLKNYALS